MVPKASPIYVRAQLFLAFTSLHYIAIHLNKHTDTHILPEQYKMKGLHLGSRLVFVLCLIPAAVTANPVPPRPEAVSHRRAPCDIVLIPFAQVEKGEVKCFDCRKLCVDRRSCLTSGCIIWNGGVSCAKMAIISLACTDMAQGIKETTCD